MQWQLHVIGSNKTYHRSCYPISCFFFCNQSNENLLFYNLTAAQLDTEQPRWWMGYTIDDKMNIFQFDTVHCTGRMDLKTYSCRWHIGQRCYVNVNMDILKRSTINLHIL